MKSFTLIAALAGLTVAVPQAVTSAIAPSASPPAGCSENRDGTFELYVVAAAKNKKRSTSTPLEITLKNGVLTDAKGRTGYIASNNQFQFDGPVQAGAIYTAGWSVCGNNSIALGGSTVFYECLSGTFYNLYDENTATQCTPIELTALSGAVPGDAAVQPDGQVTAGQAKTVLCQISDGQIQQNTCLTTATVIREQSDGQITGVPVTQIGDGQIQAGSAGSAVQTPAQQAATTTAPAVSQPLVSSNGSTPAVVTPATLNPSSLSPTAASASPSHYTGAAVLPTIRAELVGLVACIIAIVVL